MSARNDDTQSHPPDEWPKVRVTVELSTEELQGASRLAAIRGSSTGEVIGLALKHHLKARENEKPRRVVVPKEPVVGAIEQAVLESIPEGKLLAVLVGNAGDECSQGGRQIIFYGRNGTERRQFNPDIEGYSPRALRSHASRLRKRPDIIKVPDRSLPISEFPLKGLKRNALDAVGNKVRKFGRNMIGYDLGHFDIPARPGRPCNEDGTA